MNNGPKNPYKVGDKVKLSKAWLCLNAPDLYAEISYGVFESVGVVEATLNSHCILSLLGAPRSIVWPYTALTPVEKPFDSEKESILLAIDELKKYIAENLNKK